MNRRNHHHENKTFAAWARRAVAVAGVLSGGIAASAAPLPTAPATPTPYSWPTFHSGGVPAAPTAGTPTPYQQLQGTPSGLYGPVGSQVPSQIPSLIIGNTGAGTPTLPPGSGGVNGYTGSAGSYNTASFLNHFFNGPDFQNHYFQIAGPLGFNIPVGTAASSNRVQSSPTVVNASEYQEIAYMYYDGVAASPQNPIGNGTIESAPDPVPSGTPPGAVTPVTTGTHAIRQVVFFGRTETLSVVHDPTSGVNTLGGVPAPTGLAEGAAVNVSAVYAMDGFTGGIIWRYQMPSFSNGSVATNTNANSFTANISGTANSANANGPQPFQVGPTAHNSSGVVDDSATTPPLANSDTFPAGTFTTYTPSGSLPAAPTNGYQFSLYAMTAVTGANNTVTYTGDWRIFPAGTNADDANAVARGTFAVIATFDLVTDPTGHYATVSGTFSADSTNSPTFAAGFPAAFNGTFDARTGSQIISGTLQTIPTGVTLRDGSVLSSLAVARVNVTVPAGYPGGPGVATKLVVVATDNNGYVYCLDALGNGYRDPAAQANGNVLYQNTNPAGANYTTDALTAKQVHYDVQSSPTVGPTYSSFVPDTQPHIGTTFPYWIYRPDPNQPRYVAPVTGSQAVGAVKSVADFDATRDLPVPQAFENSSPTVYVNPATPVLYNTTTSPAQLGSLVPGAGPNTLLPGAAPGQPGSATGGALTTNAAVFAGSRNGVLYALDGLGLTDPKATSDTDANANTYNNSVTGNPGIDDTTDTTQTLWWFTAPGAVTSGGVSGNVSIQSAPAVLASDPNNGSNPTVYVATSNPVGGTNNNGRLYAIDAAHGPRGDAGMSDPTMSGQGPGSTDYNINPRAFWAFPDAYGKDYVINHTIAGYQSQSSDHVTKPSLGNITGSPVVFTNTDDTTTRIYFAANTGNETVSESTAAKSNPSQTFQPSDDTGRVWGVNTDGSFGFAFPGAAPTSIIAGNGTGDPNNAKASVMSPAIGGFQHATPAIGFVTFPSSIYYLNASGTPTAYALTDSQGATTFSGSANRSIPMLYVGTESATAPDVPSLYYVDLDGTTDAQRGVYAYASPDGSGFGSSPILVANTSSASTVGGNGGSVFITDGSNNLLQFQATPITTSNVNVPFPTPRLDYTFPVGDAVSAPAVGAASVSDFTGTSVTDPITGTTTTVSESVTDWVYVGDGSHGGLCFGFTPRGFGTDTTGNFLPSILPPVPPALNFPPIVNQFPLRAFVFDGSTTHPAAAPRTLDMNQANSYDLTSSLLPVFEWGQTVYLRIANVVPPGTPLSATDLTTMGDKGTVQDPTTPGCYFGNGSGITFQTVQPDTSGSGVSPAPDSFYVPPLLTTDPSLGNGFYERTDMGTTSAIFGKSSELVGGAGTAYQAPETVLLDGNSRGYAAAIAYDIGFAGALDPNGANRHNTPGAGRQILNATQTVTRYVPNTSGGGYTPQVVTLHLTATPSFTYQTTTGTPDATGTYPSGYLYVDQPTFGVLNPLAVRGAGISLTGGGSQSPWLDPNGLEGAGPFRGIATAGTLSSVDMEALANGNKVLTAEPPSGVLVNNSNPGQITTGLQANAAQFLPYTRLVVTDAGDIAHGTNGNNSDPNPLPLATGVYTSNTTSGVPTNLDYGAYLLNIADRSLLGGVGGTLNVTMSHSALTWNDNTGSGGPSARINPLSWDDYPLVGSNSSQDYPDIGAANLTEFLIGATNQPLLTPSHQSLTGASVAAGGGPTATLDRTITLQAVQASIHVPKYQSANLQLYQRPNGGSSGEGPIPPYSYSTSNLNFPMGYVASQRIAATSSPNSMPNVGARSPDAYRDVAVYTGVPVDMSTSISNQVVDIGTVPHGFGLNTQSFATGLFAPSPAGNGSYNAYFRTLTIYNDGNTNLIDPHLDQKINELNVPPTLPLLSDALDSNLFDALSYIPAYDAGGVRTGPRPGAVLGTGSYAELPYLLRSSLDTDLANDFGVSPLVTSAGVAANYPVVTFHKPRVPDAANPAFPGTTMNVPDHPHDFPSTNLPQVSIAIPLGTPVGTYSQVVRMFEGLDVPYDPIKGPTYNGVQGGYAPFNPSTLDTFQLAPNAAGVPQAEQPYSDPGVLVKGTVNEDRVTDGFTPGALPMYDAVAVNGKGAADFLPAAFRDPNSGDVSLYWTSSRNYTAGGTNPLATVLAANLTFNGGVGPATGYFSPVGQQWWNPFTLILPSLPSVSSVTNIGWNVAADQFYAVNGHQNVTDNSAYGFDTSIVGSGPTAPTDIVCYPLSARTGQQSTTTPVPVATSPQPKSGAHGLKFTGVSFTDPNGGSAITNDLWAFWAGGTRGRTALYFSAANASAVTGYASGGTSPFTGAAVLPVPASLTALANPSATLTYAPDPTTGSTGTPIPVIEVTYAGVGPSGSANLYLSRYRPYHPATNGAANNSVTLLAPLPFPRLTEQLQSQLGGNWWQARDVGWLPNANLNVTVNGTALFAAGQKPLYDRATGLLVYTNVTLSGVTGQTVFVDAGGGRVRFGRPLPANALVSVTINPTARRITTDSVADFAPSVFLDEAYQSNSDGLSPNVRAERYWFLWQKAGIPGTTTVYPTLWYKTQRLTVALTDTNSSSPTYGQPTPIPIIPTGSANAGYPNVTVTLTSSGTTLYTPGGGSANVVDVDATRGRLYFPITNGGIALEGQTVTVTVANNAATTPAIHWVDEPRYNDSSSQVAANDTTPGAIEASATDGYQVPINTIKNEGGVCAFLDPLAYNNPTTGSLVTPHSVWLFWNSTRNGTSDIFYETINPRFSPVTPFSGAP